MFSDEEISVFLDELEEKIQVLNENILILEREGGSPEALQEIFRAAHTIKGSSAVMGYEKMASLTHEMENLFDQMRKGQLPVTRRLVDALFAALDTLQALRDEIVGKGVSVDIGQVMSELRECREEQAEALPGASATGEAQELGLLTAAAIDLEEVDIEVIQEAELKGYQAYQVAVELDPGTQMKSVRAFLVFEILQQMGEIIKCVPPAEDIQEGQFESGFLLVLLSREDPDRVRNTLMTVSEVASVEVERIAASEYSQFSKQEQDSQDMEKEKPGPASKPEQAEVKTVQTVRVDVERLDTLMNLVGELVIDRTRLNRFAEIFEERFGDGSAEMVDTLFEISGHLGQVTGDLQEQIMKARMLPVARVFNRFPRMVRDLANKLGKEINFIVEGHETELDRNVIEIISDPLIHLIRNAVDHGIEAPEERARLGKPKAGVVKLWASYMENHIIITVQDDGRGLDPDKLRAKAVEKGLLDQDAAARMSDRESLNLIFLPGFSTASQVSDLSGRGVGMDVVLNKIESINGIIDISSTPGAGTTFTIRLPLTLAIVQALMVELGGEQFAFPLANVVETISVRAGEIKKVKHSEVIVVRGQILPLVRLSEIFGREACGDEGRAFVVVLGVGEKKFGVIVDKLLGELEIVIKSLGDYLGKVPCISGATILGDGQVVLIVDVKSLVKEIGIEEAIYAAG